MSYDLIVFSKYAGPKTKNEFMVWYDIQTKWTEEHTYDDPAITAPELRSWLTEMVQTFPDMNGPDATHDHLSDYETDYSIGREIIYAGFNWSLTKEVNETALRLAQKHQVGFYDSSFEGPILLPEDGELRPMVEVGKQNPKLKKPWWQLW